MTGDIRDWLKSPIPKRGKKGGGFRFEITS